MASSFGLRTFRLGLNVTFARNMTIKKVRVRFAPSPTGGLHLGGVRTALFNYLFAKKHDGDFVLRLRIPTKTAMWMARKNILWIALTWCGLTPDESPVGGHLPRIARANVKPYTANMPKD